MVRPGHVNANVAPKPTSVSDFAPGDDARWATLVQSALGAALARYGATPHLATNQDDATPERVLADWTAFPSRISNCLTRDHARLLLDWRTLRGDQGRQYQEEYAEWRTVLSDDGKIRRFELTTELPDYWLWLAGRNPARTIELIASFAGEPSVDTKAVYGKDESTLVSMSDAQRESAFERNMLKTGDSPYNNGMRAICCMRQPTNTLDALLGLVVASARRRLARDEVTGLVRCANAGETIPQLRGAAELGRNSDPVVVEQLTRLAFEGRRMALDGLPGVYIHGIQLERLVAPDGSPIPPDSFTFQRTTGADPNLAHDMVRTQRLVLEVPPEHGICIGDLIDVATGEPIRFGADLADLVQLAVHIRTSAPGVVQGAADPLPRAPPDPDTAHGACDDFQAAWRDFEVGLNMPSSGASHPDSA
jgi:hypothetical protein